MVDLKKDVQYIKGVGPNRAELLNKLGIFTLQDLITYYPRNYEDRSKPKTLFECVDGEEALIEVVATSKDVETRFRRKTMQKLMIGDETANAEAVWFNQTYLKSKFSIGQKYRMYGKIDKKYRKIQIMSPVFDEYGTTQNTGRIVPIYPLTYNLSQNVIRKIMENAISEVYGNISETLPEYLLKKYSLLSINQATKNIHFPKELQDFQKARTRLVFEELLMTQLALLKLKYYDKEKIKGIAFSKKHKISEMIEQFPFTLTNAQSRVLDEIEKDMESPKMMNRLLQGDVGSGKTAIAMCAAYKAVKSGYQAVIMAPTAILATQHLENFEKIFSRLEIKCELLISGITKKKKEDILQRLKDGT